MPAGRLIVSFLSCTLAVTGLCAPGLAQSVAISVESSLVAAEVREVRCLSRASSVSLQLHQSEHFLLFHAAHPGWARQTGTLLERSHDSFRQWLERTGFEPAPSSERLVWVCFRQARDFDLYSRDSDQMDMSWTDGYYSARTNRVALVLPPRLVQDRPAAPSPAASEDVVVRVAQVDPALAESIPHDERLDARWITHELAHQLAFNCGLQTRGVMYPLWLSEGLATNFEADERGSFGFGRDNAPRRRTLVEAHLQHRLVPLRRFVTLDRLPAGDIHQARRQYAQAWGLFHFLSGQRGVQLRQYLRTLSRLELGSRDAAALRREFIDAFGPLDRLERDWHAYLDALSLVDETQTAANTPLDDQP